MITWKRIAGDLLDPFCETTNHSAAQGISRFRMVRGTPFLCRRDPVGYLAVILFLSLVPQRSLEAADTLETNEVKYAAAGQDL